MDANTLVERVARAMRTARLIATDAAPILIAFSADAPAEDVDIAIARAALREIVAAAGGVDALNDAAAAVLDDWAKDAEQQTAALLRALAEGGSHD